MGKPFRVKRGPKYIGSWKARVGGEIINLETQDAEEARKRVRRAMKGDFGWRGDAAGAVKEILDGDGGKTGPESVESPPAEVQIPAQQSSATSPAEPVSPPTGSAGGTQSQGAAPAVDPVAAANEAAAAAAGGPADVLKEAARTLGIDLGELMKPESLGGLHIAGQSWLTQKLAKAMKLKELPPLVVPADLMPVVKVLGEAWKQRLAAWNVSVANVSPGWAILGCSAVFALVQFAAMSEAATPGAEAPVVGAG